MANNEGNKENCVNNSGSESTKKNGIVYWFRNVFIYHYIKPAITVILLLILATILLKDVFLDVKPDITVVFGGIGILRDEDMTEIKAIIADEVGDANGDGEVLVNIEIYTATLDTTDDYGEQNLEALDMAFLADPAKVLFIFDEELYLRYEADIFEKLSDFGIESEDEHFYKVNDLPVFQRLLVVDTEYYMALKGWMIDKKDNKAYIHNYDLAQRVMNRLINEK